MERLTTICTCDDNCDDPCPRHGREDQLESDLADARALLIECYDEFPGEPLWMEDVLQAIEDGDRSMVRFELEHCSDDIGPWIKKVDAAIRNMREKMRGAK